MTEKLIIKNFGPIKDAEIDLRKVNVFIGPTGSGKSVAAKLVSIFRSTKFRSEPNFTIFKDMLETFNIDFKIDKKKTKIEYHWDKTSWVVEFGKVANSNSNIAVALKLSHVVDLYNERLLDSPLQKNLLDWSVQSLVSLSRSEFFQEIRPVDFSDIEPKLFLRWIIENSEERLAFRTIVNEITARTFVIYTPAERILLSMVDSNSFSFLQKDSVKLPEYFKEFGSLYQNARMDITKHILNALDVEYQFINGQDVVVVNHDTQISLHAASSGIQSTVPVELVVASYCSDEFSTRRLLIVEEPEMNLFPTAQKKLIEFIIHRCSSSDSQLILTTHSPYVVTAVANLVLAGETGKIKGRKTKVKAIVPESQWLDYDNVSCYQFENGTVKDLRDDEMRTIDGNAIDDVSLEMSSVFHQLLELKYP